MTSIDNFQYLLYHHSYVVGADSFGHMWNWTSVFCLICKTGEAQDQTDSWFTKRVA